MIKNNKISKKGTFGTTMGVSSIIAILVVLVLIVFAALSITTAKADLTLSRKTAESTTEYYAADSAAEDKVGEVAGLINSGAGWETKLGEGYEVTADGASKIVAYEVMIDDSKALSVRLRIDAGGAISRELWQVHSTTEWESKEDLQLIIE
jgi:hypothetical protein